MKVEEQTLSPTTRNIPTKSMLLSAKEFMSNNFTNIPSFFKSSKSCI